MQPLLNRLEKADLWISKKVSTFFKFVHPFLLIWIIVTAVAVFVLRIAGRGMYSQGPLFLLLLSPFLFVGLVLGLILSGHLTAKYLKNRKLHAPPVPQK